MFRSINADFDFILYDNYLIYYINYYQLQDIENMIIICIAIGVTN